MTKRLLILATIFLIANTVKSQNYVELINDGDIPLYVTSAYVYYHWNKSIDIRASGWEVIKPNEKKTWNMIHDQTWFGFAIKLSSGKMQGVKIELEGNSTIDDKLKLPVLNGDFKYHINFKDNIEKIKYRSQFTVLPFSFGFNTPHNVEKTTSITLKPRYFKYDWTVEIPKGGDPSAHPILSTKFVSNKSETEVKKEKTFQSKGSTFINPKYLPFRNRINDGGCCHFEYLVDAVKVIKASKEEKGEKIFYDYTLQIEDDIFKDFPSKEFKVTGSVKKSHLSRKYNAINILDKLRNGSLKSIKIYVETIERNIEDGKLDYLNAFVCQFNKCLDW